MQHQRRQHRGNRTRPALIQVRPACSPRSSRAQSEQATKPCCCGDGRPAIPPRPIAARHRTTSLNPFPGWSGWEWAFAGVRAPADLATFPDRPNQFSGEDPLICWAAGHGATLGRLPSMGLTHGPLAPGWECQTPKTCRTAKVRPADLAAAHGLKLGGVAGNTLLAVRCRCNGQARADERLLAERNFGFRGPEGFSALCWGQGRHLRQGCRSKPRCYLRHGCAPQPCGWTDRCAGQLQQLGEALPQLLDQLECCAGAGAGPHGGTGIRIDKPYLGTEEENWPALSASLEAGGPRSPGVRVQLASTKHWGELLFRHPGAASAKKMRKTKTGLEAPDAARARKLEAITGGASWLLGDRHLSKLQKRTLCGCAARPWWSQKPGRVHTELQPGR